jgi:hypothetical protein
MSDFLRIVARTCQILATLCSILPKTNVASPHRWLDRVPSNEVVALPHWWLPEIKKKILWPALHTGLVTASQIYHGRIHDVGVWNQLSKCGTAPYYRGVKKATFVYGQLHFNAVLKLVENFQHALDHLGVIISKGK